MADRIQKIDKVAGVLDRRPELLDIFLAFGFTQLTNPIMRRTMARKVTIEQACRFRGVDVQEFPGKLNSELERISGNSHLPSNDDSGKSE